MLFSMLLQWFYIICVHEDHLSIMLVPLSPLRSAGYLVRHPILVSLQFYIPAHFSYQGRVAARS